MLITTLGTSHGNHTMTRNNSSTLVQTDGAAYLVDCGEPVAGTLERAGKWDPVIRTLFITHMHADHIGARNLDARHELRIPAARGGSGGGHGSAVARGR